MMKLKLSHLLSSRRFLLLLLADLAATTLSLVLAGLIFAMVRFGWPLGLNVFFNLALKFWWLLPVLLAVRLGTFYNLGLYQLSWRYASVKETLAIVRAVVIGSVIIMAFLFIIRLTPGREFPVTLLVLEMFLNVALVGSLRLSARLLREWQRPPVRIRGSKSVLIVGAGDAGEMIGREILRNPHLGYFPVGYVDDNPSCQGQIIHQVPVVGTSDDIPEVVDKLNVDEVVIAIPSATSEVISKIVKKCEQTRARIKITPGIYELLGDRVSIKQVRDVRIEDLLGRQTQDIDLEEIASYLTGQTVLVTGAGGSIGSELCRQMAAFAPRLLVLFGRGENSVYEIQMELKQRHPQLPVAAVIGDIRHQGKLEAVFRRYRPNVVFHAAAHKHVPLMEDHPDEAVLNNVLGTRNVVEFASKYGVKSFVFISSDKAVNPTSVMGATKRVAEMIVQAQAQKSPTHFVIVRFGNVLDSRGSVVPLFRKQIAEGGPVTVTHPEVERYFMTMTEAAQLVIQSGAMGKGGEVFILDMGQPIKVTDLAKEMIKLSGYKPGVDIAIKYVGLRPGEKLKEELLTKAEGVTATSHEKIFVARPEKIDASQLAGQIEELAKLALAVEGEGVKAKLRQVVTNYRPNGG